MSPRQLSRHQHRRLGALLSVPLDGHRIPLAFNLHLVHKTGSNDILPETILLKQL
jgi:hypothetical protein